MKKIVIRIGIALGISIAIILVAGSVFIYMMQKETGKMRTAQTGEIIKGVYAINDDYVNMYLIRSDKGYIAIDGCEKIDKVEKEIGKTGIDPKLVLAVFLTHSDFDHVGAIPLFANATVYLSRDEEQMINGTTSRMFITKNKLNAPYRLLDNNQTITIGGVKIQCLSMPGHTPGSMAYLVNNSLLFTGDSLSLKDGKAEVFNELFNMDTGGEKRSIAKIAIIPRVQYVFTAHYGYTANFAGAFEKWKQP